ncbi:hypothetical protein GCM10027579_01750 [Calidifontibacter terrae]
MIAATSAPADAAVLPYGYEVAGTPVTAATSGAGPILGPGLYRLDLPNDGSPRTITVERSAFPNLVADVLSAETEGSSLTATGDHSLEIALVGPDDTECDTDTDTLSADDAIDHLTTQVGYDAGKDGRFNSWSGCQEASSLTLKITHTATRAAGTTPAELLLSSEPQATSGAGVAATTAELGVLKPAKGATQDAVTGGRGFTQATTLTGGTYPTELTAGGWTYFRVRVGWGQRVAAELRVPADGSNFAPPAGVSVKIGLFSPQRVDITPGYSADTTTTSTMYSNESSQDTLNVFSAPVRVANRAPATSISGPIDRDALRFTTAAGWYYLGIQTEPSDTTPGTALKSLPKIPADLAIHVSGTEQQGPTYENSTEPLIGKMSVGNGVDQSSIPWVRLSLSVIAILLAAVAVLWALRQRRSE